jgi:PTS system cellobiose-specific IIC component
MLTSAGIVARCAGVTVFNVPMIFTGIMNGNISIALMEIGLFIIDILLFMPFIKVLEKNYIVEENTK